jgi:hypothetical protein
MNETRGEAVGMQRFRVCGGVASGESEELRVE